MDHKHRSNYRFSKDEDTAEVELLSNYRIREEQVRHTKQEDERYGDRRVRDGKDTVHEYRKKAVGKKRGRRKYYTIKKDQKLGGKIQCGDHPGKGGLGSWEDV